MGARHDDRKFSVGAASAAIGARRIQPGHLRSLLGLSMSAVMPASVR
ncbi:YSIRK-type signal peptide-containing protein [Luteibacter sp. RCC_6_2]